MKISTKVEILRVFWVSINFQAVNLSTKVEILRVFWDSRRYWWIYIYKSRNFESILRKLKSELEQTSTKVEILRVFWATIKLITSINLQK